MPRARTRRGGGFDSSLFPPPFKGPSVPARGKAGFARNFSPSAPPDGLDLGPIVTWMSMEWDPAGPWVTPSAFHGQALPFFVCKKLGISQALAPFFPPPLHKCNSPSEEGPLFGQRNQWSTAFVCLTPKEPSCRFVSDVWLEAPP